MPKELSEKNKKRAEEIKSGGNIPQHVAIIMDGNGRWAKKKGLPRVAGHKQGVETVREIVQASVALGVKYLTIYTFSTENWKRPKDEVSTLMRLVVQSLRKEVKELDKNGVRLTYIGDSEKLPGIVCQELKEAMAKTSANNRLVLNLALSYSGRWDILTATKNILTDIEKGVISKESIDEEMFSKYLSTKDLPDPDLLIRSGGELRVSNYLLWQIAYSEIYVTKTLWPNFTAKDLFEAIEDYQTRERRFGLVSEQLSKDADEKN